MSVAVPPATLYTYHMYKHIAKFRCTGGRVKAAMIAVQKGRGLSDELHKWREVRLRMNGASWYDATHHSIKLTGVTDVSSSGWGGIVRGPFKSLSVFKAAADFPAEWIDVHINMKETFALLEVLRLLVAQYPDHLSGTTLVVDVDNTTMFHAFRKGRARDERMHDLIKSLVWLQVDSDFTLKLKWVYSADNKDADDLTGPGAVEHVRSEQQCFGRLREGWGGFDMDLMATGTSVQWIPGRGQGADRALLFYSRYHTDGTAGVDVLVQDAIGHLLRLISTILPVVQSLLSSLCAGKFTPTSAPTPVRVAVARGRVLCPECHGENDDMFHFCQWCVTPSTCYSISAEGARLSIDEAAVGARYTTFTTSLENKTSTVGRKTDTTLLGQFISSRTTGGAVGMATTQRRDIVQFLCWLDSCSNRRCTVVHAMHCTQVKIAEPSGC